MRKAAERKKYPHEWFLYNILILINRIGVIFILTITSITEKWITLILRYMEQIPRKSTNQIYQYPLIPQHYYKTNFLSTWATKSCPGFCSVEEFTYLSVAKINKQNSDMTWRRYKLNLRNSLLLEEYFQSWTRIFHLRKCC